MKYLSDDYTHAAAVADVNGDRAPDNFVGQIGGTADNEIQLNDRSGHFSAEPDGIADDLANPQACSVVLSAAFTDVDGNGDEDLVLGGGFNPCYPMNGDGAPDIVIAYTKNHWVGHGSRS